MNELVKRVTEKTGLSEEMATQVITVVLDYVKDKLPAPIAAQLDNFLEGGGDLGDLGGLAKGLGGMFG